MDRTRAPALRFPAILFLTVVTGAYLCLEAPFAAHLVDVLDTILTDEQLDRLQQMGRFLSGCAIAIAIWPLILKRAARNGTSFVGTTLRLVVSGAIAIGVFFVSEKQIVDTIVENSSVHYRQQALEAFILQRADIKASPDARHIDPAWNAYYAMLPALYMTGAKPIDDLNALSAINTYVADVYPSALSHKALVYDKSMTAIRTLWSHYNAAAFGYKSSMDNLGSSHIPQIQAGWRNSMESLFGKGVSLSPHIDRFEEFERADPVQDVLRSRLGLPRGTGLLTEDLQPRAYEEQVYGPLKALFMGDVKSALTTNPGLLGETGKLKLTGRSAAHNTIVPGLSLTLSTLGMLVHLFKFLNFATALVTGFGSRRISPRLRHALVASVIAGSVLLASNHPVGLTTLPSNSNMASQLTNALVGFQGLGYPLAKTVKPYGGFWAVSQYLTNGVQFSSLSNHIL